MAKKKINRINDIFPDDLTVEITSPHIGEFFLTNNGLYRANASPYSIFEILFSKFDDTIEDFTPVAFMKLHTGLYPDMHTALVALDSESEDSFAVWDSADYYLEHYDDNNDTYSDRNFGDYAIVELRNLYIDPAYRGNGLSEELTLMLPLLLEQCGITQEAIISTTVNPYKKYNQKLTVNNAGDESAFDGYDGDSEQIISYGIKSLKKCGFKKVKVDGDGNKNRFVASTRDIEKASRKRNIPRAQGYPSVAWE